MDNFQMPPVGGQSNQPQPNQPQPNQPNQLNQYGQPIQPAQPIQSAAPMQPGMPMVQQVQVMPEEKKDVAGLIKTIAIITLSLIAATFIGLFIWMTVQYNGLNDELDWEGKIERAVAEAKDEQFKQDEADRIELEKYPYQTFSGPVDYGQLTFEYPKTWSVYVAAAASTGGDFHAYFNPVKVDAVSDDTINALRVTIYDKSFDEVTADYQKKMDKKDSGLTMEAVTIGRDANITANRYSGNIPDTKAGLTGIIVTFKIRDKTAVLQTDAMSFQEDFDKLLGTVTFNE